MNLTLFPKYEEWGTGDESQDLQLSKALNKAAAILTLESIADFYFFGFHLRPRAYNPGLPQTIELVTKALLFHFSSDDYNDVLLKKIKGRYFLKEKNEVSWDYDSHITHELKKHHFYRYKDQIDFHLISQSSVELNPYVPFPLKKSPFDLQTKIIFKDFKAYLNGAPYKGAYDADSFFQILKDNERIQCFENFAEFWFDELQIYSLNKMIV